MPRSRSTSRGAVTRLVLFAVLGGALYALRRDGSEDMEPEGGEIAPAVDRPVTEEAKPAERARPRTRVRSRRRRFATSLAFTTLFFAGAALSAGAGDAVVEAMESDSAAACAGATDAEPATCPDPADEASGEGTQNDATAAPVEEQGGTEPAPEDAIDDSADTSESADVSDDSVNPSEDSASASGDSAGTTTAPPADTATETTDEGDADAGGLTGDNSAEGGSNDGSLHQGNASGGSSDGANNGTDRDNDAPAGPPVVAPAPAAHEEETTDLDPEADAFGLATVWLHRELPDPIRPAERLAPAFANALRAESKRAHVGWTMVLAVVRAEGETGRVPASRAELRLVARKLHRLLNAEEEWQALLAYHGRTAFADRAMALTRYNRAVGLRALVRGFDASKKDLEALVLADSRLDIYGGGRADIAAGRVNVRVLVLMRYLAEAFGSVRVSSLQTGHGLYARPGVISAHVYGLAVDVAALGGRPIMGNSSPGGLTEKAVRDILLLPGELRPRQVISLLGLGGPSFPLANHYDHIHVGY